MSGKAAVDGRGSHQRHSGVVVAPLLLVVAPVPPRRGPHDIVNAHVADRILPLVERRAALQHGPINMKLGSLQAGRAFTSQFSCAVSLTMYAQCVSFQTAPAQHSPL